MVKSEKIIVKGNPFQKEEHITKIKGKVIYGGSEVWK